MALSTATKDSTTDVENRGRSFPTEALHQDTREMVVLPTAPAGQLWARTLRRGDITYDEYIDWTTTSEGVTKPWRKFWDTVLAGISGGAWKR
jgi:hypothetical protein